MNRQIKFLLYVKEPDGNIRRIPFRLELTDKTLRFGNATFEENTILGIAEFTGLTDRNGREIYEGDIVEWCDSNTGKLYWMGEVKFGEHKIEYTDTDYGTEYVLAYGWYVHHPQYQLQVDYSTDKEYIDTSPLQDFYNVVGHIYESPELNPQP